MIAVFLDSFRFCFTLAAFIVLPCFVAGCDPPGTIKGTQVEMRFDRPWGLYSAPVPSDDLRHTDGSMSLSSYPNPADNAWIKQVLAVAGGQVRGAGVSSAIYFQTSDPIGVLQLPTLSATTHAGSPVVLIGADENAPDYLTRYPLVTSFYADGGPYGAHNLLGLLPLQGITLRPHTLYVAAVLRSLKDKDGNLLGVGPTMALIQNGTRPPELDAAAWPSYQRGLRALAAAGIAKTDIAGMTAFTTADPGAELERVLADALGRKVPAPLQPLQLSATFDDYCVYRSVVAMPEYQAGDPPYTREGGGWAFDEGGAPVWQRDEQADLVLTVPRRPPPAAGLPLVVLSRTGLSGSTGSDYTPLTDRGHESKAGGPADVPGSGPALEFARAGWAGLSIDGPHSGRRNVSMSDEQMLIINFTNPLALRDNIRQSALELALAAHIAAGLTVDTSGCAGVSATAPVTIDKEHLVLMGHSLGATIAPLALAAEPLYRGAILSGAGSSWIENILYKLKPFVIRPLAEVLVGYINVPRLLVDELDPVLSLVQWAAEPADPLAVARAIINEPPAGARPKHVLMFQGIVDHYIMPNIANPMTLSLGLDLGGEPIDQTTDLTLALQAPIGGLLTYSGRHQITLPASGNITVGDEKITGVVVQHPEDGIEDGHEMVFQTDAPKAQYRCFLRTLLAGVPTVPAVGGVCPN